MITGTTASASLEPLCIFIPRSADPTNAAGAASTPKMNCGDVENNANKIKAQDKINIIRAKYIASAVKKAQYPEERLKEIAFIGRSNVGKSSLINSLTRVHNLARVSGQPGKTQTINFYEFNC